VIADLLQNSVQCCFGRYQPVSPPPTKRIKHERLQVDGSGRGAGHGGRVKAEAALGSAWHRDTDRRSTPRSVIVISDTEDDSEANANTLSVLM